MANHEGPRNGADEQTSGPESRERDHASEAPQKSSFPIVGIGASAGGLEPITTLLKSLEPDPPMAFVVVTHLDPTRDSAFVEILSRCTTLPVTEIEDGKEVEIKHVYVIPRNCELTIKGKVFHLDKLPRPRTSNVTIDVFFRSLASSQGNNAIGVILSGAATDGTLGIAAIKGEGGITFAQDESAKYTSMPASAISAGFVDFIMPPDEIAAELGRIVRHPYVVGHALQTTNPDGGRDAVLGQVFRLLHRTTKVDFSEYKLPTITRRIQRRMALHKIETLAEYSTLLHRNRNEVGALYQDLLINVTSFFRNPDAFDTLKDAVYPTLLQAHDSGLAPIRVWVPGCSTGEEPYSHAIALVEYLAEARVELPVQIFGTDLSESAIKFARAGIYKHSIEDDVTPVRLRRFFQKVESGYQISKTIRDMCIFSTQNVVSDPPFSRMDLVSCRNVMIYLGHSLQKRIIPVFHYALNASGFLMIGNTEGLLAAGTELFELAEKKQKIYRKKLVRTPATFGFSVNPPPPPIENFETNHFPERSMEVLKAPADVQREAERLLLQRYVPPAVVVNEQLEIQHIKGQTGAYLELPTGRATLNLLKMANSGLLFELQAAIEEAKRTGVDARPRPVILDKANSKTVTLRVTPFKTPIQDTTSLLIVFEEESLRPASGPLLESARSVAPLTDDERSQNEQQTAQMRQELAATKEYLQSINESQEITNEELQSANEEIQSGNEELQSTNEELQTSKEELESANEELHTVNDEMQHRNEQLSQLNNDLNNLLNSVNLPMVMVGPDLSVRRFTPQAGTILGLHPSDVGRPIPKLRLKVDVHDLEQTMLDVMEEVQPRQHQVRDAEGNLHEFRITPYRTHDNRIDGVVLSVVGLNGDKESKNTNQDDDKKAGPKGRM